MKKCPYCSEKIQEDAIKCRFCGEFLENSSPKQTNFVKQGLRKNITIIMVIILLIILPLAFFIKRNNDIKKEERLELIATEKAKEEKVKKEMEDLLQKDVDEAALKALFDGIEKWDKCMGDEDHYYQFWADCLESSGLSSRSFNGTLCDNELNVIVQAIIDAKEHCAKAAFYEDGDYIKRDVSIETYTNETAKCSSAIDQFSNIPIKCGKAYLINVME